MYITKYKKYTKCHGALTTGIHIYAAVNVLNNIIIYYENIKIVP